MNFLSRHRGHWTSRQISRLIAGMALAFVLLSLESGIWNAAWPPDGAEPTSKPASSDGDAASRTTSFRLDVHSNMAAIADAETSTLLYEKNASRVTPIASITKLMTAIVTLDAKLPLTDLVTISEGDIDDLKGTRSFLSLGTTLSREAMMHLALMSSENRAAACLSRYFPGGRPAFITAMNRKAQELGMENSRFVSPNGLSPEDVSTARDLVKLVRAACQYPLIRQFSTDSRFEVYVGKLGRVRLQYGNTDRLVGREDWDIELQKTGFINESGRCLVMDAQVDGRNLIMVFLDAYGRLTCFADARRVRRQLAVVERRR